MVLAWWLLMGGVSALVVRIIVVGRQIYQARRTGQCPWRSSRPRRPLRTLVVLGSGGHTAELLDLVQTLDSTVYTIEYVKANTDTTSANRLPPSAKLISIPRAREVGQSYLSSAWTTLRALWSALLLVYQRQPDVILCNGPGTCLPIVLAALLWRVCGRPCAAVFVESLCRTWTLSLTGRLLYPFVDVFCVHWTSLVERYPSAVRLETFVEE